MPPYLRIASQSHICLEAKLTGVSSRSTFEQIHSNLMIEQADHE
jgi:hypothetical protein